MTRLNYMTRIYVITQYITVLQYQHICSSLTVVNLLSRAQSCEQRCKIRVVGLINNG